MATRAEQARARAERHGHEKPKARKTTKKGPQSKHAGKKATYAYEVSAKRPSRKSTRASANRTKPDASLVGRAALTKSSPEARYRKARARRQRPRGSS
jgi:hypothetical protein